MHLEQIRVRGFRNIEGLQWRPAEGLNLVWGDNGQGKTNLLEAIHMVSTGRSFRTRREGECRPWAARGHSLEPTRLEGDLMRRTGGRHVRVVLGDGWKRVQAEGTLVRRLADLWAETAVVTFTPEASGVFKASPTERRRLLDMAFSHISKDYLANLQRYGQTLRQVNTALKQPDEDASVRETVNAYLPMLAQTAARVIAVRGRRLEQARPAVALRFDRLGGHGRLELQYVPNLQTALQREGLSPASLRDRIEQTAAALHKHYQAAFREARATGSMPHGPHRDDLAIYLDGQDLRRYGSQGQHRLAALTLKLEIARWIEEALGESPVLLFDDFGSELDPDRREAVLEGFRGRMQVFVTATRPSDLGRERLFGQSRRIIAGRLH